MHKLRRHGLAIEPLLQIAEWCDRDRALILARNKQFPIECAFKDQLFEDVGEGAGNIVAGARIELSDPLLGDGLHADTVPLPLGRVVLRIELFELALVERLRQHHRAEGR